MGKNSVFSFYFTGDLQPPKHTGDVGWDLPSVSFREQYLAGGSSNVFQIFTGVRLFLPLDLFTWAEIRPRSSALQKHGLIIIPGTIDRGYRGELVISCYQLRYGAVENVVRNNISVAQVVFLHSYHPHMTRLAPEEFTDLALEEASSRGSKGFGSTDQNIVVDKSEGLNVSLETLEDQPLEDKDD